MNEWTVVDETQDVFDLLVDNHRALLAAQCQELILIAQACDEYTVDESRADAAAEKLIVGGSEGTALVGEFLALELAGLLQISPTAAALRIREVLNLRDRHPELWALVCAGAVVPWRAMKVAARCASAGLSAEAAGWVDHQLCLALAVQPWPRAERLLEGLIVRADPALAAQRAAAKRDARQVYVGDHGDGGSVLFARLDTADAVALDDTIGRLADRLAAGGDCLPLDERRARALGVLADPRAAADLLDGAGDGRPTSRRATLVVHIAADAVSAEAGVARVEGIGPLDTTTMRQFLADSHVTVRPVIDLNAIPAVDAYEVPERLRELVEWRNPVEVFPFSVRATRTTGRRLDTDHTIPYDHHAPPGSRQTGPGNLGPCGRRAHRAKTACLWRVEQTEPGVFVWTSRHRFRYEVSPDGTTALGREPRAGRSAPAEGEGVCA